MAKLVVIAPYYKPGHKTATGSSRGGYAAYIAKREGVEIPRGGMVGYIGERKGSHGLFSDEGIKLSISQVKEEIDRHPGNVWGFIISLKREDAERLGYNTADQWMHLLRSRRNDIAKEMHIAPGNLRWVAAYHNKETNPHVHMMVWSAKPNEPYLSRVGIHNIKHTLANDIFRQELICVYRKQTEAREDVKEQCRERIRKLANGIRNGKQTFSPELVQRFTELTERLSQRKGKKIYGYLDKTSKDMVNGIVKLLAEDKTISALYDAWYELKFETIRTYTDTMPEKIPLEENDDFKSIRNQVVTMAAELGRMPEQPDRDIDYEYPIKDENESDFNYLYTRAQFTDNPMIFYRLGRYYLEKTDDMNEAEFWLKLAGDKGITLASYLVYKGYRDGKFTDKPSDKMKYLRKAVDGGFGYAAYEYGKLIKDKHPDIAMQYFEKAANHGSFQAEYMMGKMYLEQGDTEKAKILFDRSAKHDSWTQTAVGLLYYYEFGDHDKGMEYLNTAAENGYTPAAEAIHAIHHQLNAEIIIGLCDLFYYAGNIFESSADDVYARHQVSDHGFDRRLRQQDRAKRMGYTMSW